MEKRIPQEEIRERVILDPNTGGPVKEIVVGERALRVVRESGEEVEIPLGTLRAKAILTRLETGLGEITGPIYV